jgi:hypothetical protein
LLPQLLFSIKLICAFKASKQGGGWKEYCKVPLGNQEMPHSAGQAPQRALFWRAKATGVEHEHSG